MKWYVLHKYTGQEDRVKESIEKGVLDTDLAQYVGEILVPKQKTYHIREGKKVEREKKIFNSYIIIEADLNAKLSTFIMSIAGVTHFLGVGKKAVPLSKEEVDRLKGVSQRDKSESKTYDFLPGDKIKIIAGPFTDFEGVVDKISQEAAKLTVKVTVFGRVTPVEVNMEQVEII